MSIELIGVLVAVLTVGVALAGLILSSSRGLRQDIRQDVVQLETRVREDISQLRDDMKQLGDRVARVEHSQAKIEGLLEGLREAITGRPAAS